VSGAWRSSCTPAGGKAGPDLTHLASRHYIAAGALPRNRDTLAAWIIDPEHIKPGARMPPSKLQTNEVELLVSYLQGLK
jgi:cytochrome c oxidase subunit 2